MRCVLTLKKRNICFHTVQWVTGCTYWHVILLRALLQEPVRCLAARAKNSQRQSTKGMQDVNKLVHKVNSIVHLRVPLNSEMEIGAEAEATCRQCRCFRWKAFTFTVTHSKRLLGRVLTTSVHQLSLDSVKTNTLSLSSFLSLPLSTDLLKWPREAAHALKCIPLEFGTSNTINFAHCSSDQSSVMIFFFSPPPVSSPFRVY